MDDEVIADAASGLQLIVDAVDRGDLTATSVDELELVLRLEGATEDLRRWAGLRTT